MSFPKRLCANRDAVVALYGKSPIVRKLDSWDAAVKLLGNPLLTSFEANHLITIKVPGDWVGGKSEVKIRVNKAIAHLFLAAFEEIRNLKIGYTLEYCGAYVFRYNTAKMSRLKGRDEYSGLSGGDLRFSYAEKDRKDGAFDEIVAWVDKKKKSRSASKKTMLSNHAFGSAIDLNYGANPMGSEHRFDMPQQIVDVFAKYGFYWGGYYHDYTHFEYALDHIVGSVNVPVVPPVAKLQKVMSQKLGSKEQPNPTLASLMSTLEFTKDWLEQQWQQYQDKKREDVVDEAHEAIQSDSGFFPVGLNLTWHGGIHCKASSDGSVHAVTDGIVVAARLPQKDPAKLSYGSRNFVLVKHKTLQGKTFWSLFMHLRPIMLKHNDKNLASLFPWLVKRCLVRIGEGASNLRNLPDTEHSEVIAELMPGETFDVFDEKSMGSVKWLYVHAKRADKTGWIALTSKFDYKTEIPNLDDLKAGKVVKFKAPVKRGDCLGFISPAPQGKYPFLHWEIFSSELVSSQWLQIKDADNDIICDSDAFKKILNKSEAVTFLDPLTKDNIRAAYRDEKIVAQIRRRAFFFKSEWAVDWNAALDKLKDDYDVKDLAPRLQLYNFWKDAEVLGCDLPKGGKVWHYHPLEFINREFPVPKAVVTSKSVHAGAFDGQYEYKNRDGENSVEKWTISDNEFLDKDSLSQERITEICNQKNPELVKRGFDVGIYRFSQREGINSKVILATLASEQGWCKKGKYDKAFGVGAGGNPQSFGSDGGMPKAVKTYLKHFNVARDVLEKSGHLEPMLINHDSEKAGYPESKAVFGRGLSDWQREHPKYVEYMEKGIKLQPLNAAMYAKLKYTPWTDFPPQGSHSLATWHKFFRSF